MENLYNQIKPKFPLIAAVIEGRQKGTILKNDPTNPTHAFVINKFGFCQEFYTQFDASFFTKITNLVQAREYVKLRMYAPTGEMEQFLNNVDFADKSERIQFTYVGNPGETLELAPCFEIRKLSRNDLLKANLKSVFIDRYWNDDDDFFENAMPFGAFVNSQTLVGMCYTAGIGMNTVEFDIFVDKEKQRQKLGEALAQKFIRCCQSHRLSPSWDCYTNNMASLRLAEKVGFKETVTYVFYNIAGRAKGE